MKVTLDKGAKLPTRAHETDAGWDLYAKEDFVVPKCQYAHFGVSIGNATHDTGVHIEIPAGFVGFLKSKSGLNVKHGLTSEGVIDCGYTGSIVVKLYNHTDTDFCFKKGEKITQLVILPINTEEPELAESLAETERGEKGFGSSGK